MRPAANATVQACSSATLFLVVRPGALIVASLLLVAMPFAPSSVLMLPSQDGCSSDLVATSLPMHITHTHMNTSVQYVITCPQHSNVLISKQYVLLLLAYWAWSHKLTQPNPQQCTSWCRGSWGPVASSWPELQKSCMCAGHQALQKHLGNLQPVTSGVV